MRIRAFVLSLFTAALLITAGAGAATAAPSAAPPAGVTAAAPALTFGMGVQRWRWKHWKHRGGARWTCSHWPHKCGKFTMTRTSNRKYVTVSDRSPSNITRKHMRRVYVGQPSTQVYRDIRSIWVPGHCKMRKVGGFLGHQTILNPKRRGYWQPLWFTTSGRFNLRVTCGLKF